MLALSACGPLSSLNSATRPLPTYTLPPLPPQEGARASARSVFVAEPVAPAAISTDRIVMKPSAIQVTLLPDGRWADTAPAHLREVLTRSLANTGRFALVTRGTAGPIPDYTLMIDIESFEARRPTSEAVEARVAMTLTILRNTDGRLVASRRFAQGAAAADTDALSVVAAFEAANTALLRQAVDWATRVMTGG